MAEIVQGPDGRTYTPTSARPATAAPTPPAPSRAAEFFRGLWQATLYALVAAVGLSALTFGLVSQFDPDSSRAIRATVLVCGAGFLFFALVGVVVGGMIFATRHYALASAAAGQKAQETAAAATQKAIETTAASTQQAISSLTHQMELMGQKHDATINVLTQMVSAQLEAQRSQTLAIPPAPPTQSPRPDLEATLIGPTGAIKQMRAGPQVHTIDGLTVRETTRGDEVGFDVEDSHGRRHIIKYSAGIARHFIETMWPTPQQTRWQRFTDAEYGNCARLFELAQFLYADGAGWGWALNHEAMVAHWNRAFPQYAVRVRADME